MASGRPLLRSAVAVAAVAVLASGCATIPTVGQPKQVTGSSGLAQPYVQPVPPVPEPSWRPQDIVHGFLAASASFANQHAAARRFLAQPLRDDWKPAEAVTVASDWSSVQSGRNGPASLKGASATIDTVTVTGRQLATINDLGQYSDTSGAQVTYTFKLAKFDRQWLIIDLPKSAPLLLTVADFQAVYQPRNLYFWSPAGNALVPEPVSVPEQDTDASVATRLVDALLLSNQDQSSEQASWLAAATISAFPRGTTLLQPVTFAGSAATVDLGGTAASAGPAALQNMAAQLVITLTSTSYNQPPISKGVVLEINGKVSAIGGQRVQQPPDYLGDLPGSQQGLSTLSFISPSGAVSEFPAGSTSQRLLRGPAGNGQLEFRQIATSPDEPSQLAGVLATGKGCVLYYGNVDGAALRRRALPDPASGHCDSLSWDALGDIWAVAGSNIWVLPPDGRQPVAISAPPLPGTKPSSYQVLALRVAPDGVRVAMLIQAPGAGREIVLTAVSRSGSEISFGPTVTVGQGVINPTALSWYDADHLIVLAQSQLYEVPVNGGDADSLGPVPPGTTSVTAASPGQVATGGVGQIRTSASSDQFQQSSARGTDPVYPG